MVAGGIGGTTCFLISNGVLGHQLYRDVNEGKDGIYCIGKVLASEALTMVRSVGVGACWPLVVANWTYDPKTAHKWFIPQYLGEIDQQVEKELDTYSALNPFTHELPLV